MKGHDLWSCHYCPSKNSGALAPESSGAKALTLTKPFAARLKVVPLHLCGRSLNIRGTLNLLWVQGP